MRISDWSSDVCSSDLVLLALVFGYVRLEKSRAQRGRERQRQQRREPDRDDQRDGKLSIDSAGRTGEKGHRHERSEEHTSELQSLMRISYAVFCLKKKKH